MNFFSVSQSFEFSVVVGPLAQGQLGLIDWHDFRIQTANILNFGEKYGKVEHVQLHGCLLSSIV